MTLTNKMLDGIKQGLTRQQMAEAFEVPVAVISRNAGYLLRHNDYRAAGISDENFAKWFEASMVGLKTEDGEMFIGRTEPNPLFAERILKLIQKGFEVEVPTQKGGFVKSCWTCKHRNSFANCAKHAYAEDRSIGCNGYAPVMGGKKQ